MDAENLKEGGCDLFPGTILAFAYRMRDTETVRICSNGIQV